MERNTFASPIFLACGIELLDPQAVSVFFFTSLDVLVGLILPTETFAATGWRVGWLIGPPSIIQPTLAATTRIVFCTNSPLQEAAAAGLEQARERKYFETQLEEYTERRAVLTDVFDKLGLKYTLPEGSYFILLVGHHCSTIAFEVLMRTQSLRISPTSDFLMIIRSPRVFWAGVGISSTFSRISFTY